jgi:cytochrome P450
MIADHDFTFFIIYYPLFNHPVALTRIRVEHDEVFASNLSKTFSILIEQAHLINQLSYTLAVIKETLRLFSAVFVMRDGLSEVELKDTHDRRYSTAGMNI